MKRITTIIALLASFVAALLPGAAEALTYKPPSFDFTANPGDTVSDALKIENESPAPITVELEAVNFVGREGDETSGVPEFLPAEAKTGHELAPWIALPVSKATLGPGQQVSLAFTIAVPKDAEPGSRFGALVITTSAVGGEGVGVIGKSASLVLLRVGGTANEDLRLTSFAARPQIGESLPVSFEARFENHGNIHERPYGEIVIRDIFGRAVEAIPMNRFEYKSVLPDSARRYGAAWQGRHAVPKDASLLVRQWKNFALGPYTAELNLKYGPENKLMAAKTTFWVIPWLALLVGLGSLTAVVMAIRVPLRWRRKRLEDIHP